jgi:hypothetical protein
MLPATYAILSAENLFIHQKVSRITLHGSRGIAGKYRPSSDIDLSLLIDLPTQTTKYAFERLLHSVYETTQNNWQSSIELDLAIIFDTRKCGLLCFNQKLWQEHICTIGGIDCFGLYKVQKGFNGLVTNAGIQVRQMYPCLQIWRRK